MAISLVFALIRLVVLFASPLQLYPDEAQYWVWSRELAFGYFSKPPMIAWLIRLTTLLGGGEAFVRLSSPFLHAATGLFIYATGRRLYDARIGLLGLLIYTLMPAVQLGAFVASTDTPLIAFLSAALWLYVVVQQTQASRKVAAAGGLGVALGLAFLSKYAVLYALIGIGLHLAVSADARRAWTARAAVTAALGFAIVAGPNLMWNATHGFATVAHTADNADWNGGHLFRLNELASFLGAQLGVFGAAPFVVLVGVGGVLAARRRLRPPDALLLCWAIPPLAIITAEAFISRAHVNWAVTAYLPGSILVAAWLVREPARWARWTLVATVVCQGLVAAGFSLVLLQPGLTDAVGFPNAFAGMRAWREVTGRLVQRARAETAVAPLTAVAVDNRYLFNEAAFYGSDFFGRGAPPLRAWVGAGGARNQAQLVAPLTAGESGRVLAASLYGTGTQTMMQGFAKTSGLQTFSARVHAHRELRLDTFIGEGLAAMPASTPSP